MTYKEVQSLLQNLKGKKARLKAMQSYINKEREQLEGVSAVKYDKLVVKASQCNGTEARYIKCIDRLNDLVNRYDELTEDLHNDENSIFNLMQKLSPTEYEVILNRFLRGLTCTKTARIMGYSIDGIKDAQTRAIRKMSK